MDDRFQAHWAIAAKGGFFNRACLSRGWARFFVARS